MTPFDHFLQGRVVTEITLMKYSRGNCYGMKHEHQLKITLSTLLISIDLKRFLQACSQYHSPNGGQDSISGNDSFFCRHFFLNIDMNRIIAK